MSIKIQLLHFVLRTHFTLYQPDFATSKHLTSLMLFMLRALVLMELVTMGENNVNYKRNWSTK